MGWLSSGPTEVTAEGVKVPKGALDVRQAYPQPLTLRQQWIVGLSALLLDPKTGSCARLHPSAYVHPVKSPRNESLDLRAMWQISNEKDLIDSLNWLLDEGQRGELAAVVGHPPLAWDLARVVVLPRRAFGAGFIDEERAWALAEAAVVPAYRAYNSWESFVGDCLLGRNAWRGHSDDWMERHVARWWSPELRDVSPWQSVPWDAVR